MRVNLRVSRLRSQMVLCVDLLRSPTASPPPDGSLYSTECREKHQDLTAESWLSIADKSTITFLNACLASVYRYSGLSMF